MTVPNKTESTCVTISTRYPNGKKKHTHSYGLKINISGGNLSVSELNVVDVIGLRHTSNEVPNMLSLTKDMVSGCTGMYQSFSNASKVEVFNTYLKDSDG